MTQTASRSLLILLPVYNDWEPLHPLLDQIDAVLAGLDQRATVLVIDDGSSERPNPQQFHKRFVTLDEVHLLSLRRNLGHQRAIAVGLAFAHDNFGHDLVLIMDADGQDSPQDIPKLLMRLDAIGGNAIVFAQRKRRGEGLAFKFFYWLFRLIHRLLTGHAARVGNFSVMSRSLLRRLMVVPELWNNYSAAVVKARLPMELTPLNRAKRIAGQTRMNFAGLVSHGLGKMSVFNDVIGVRTLSVAIVLTLAAAVWVGVLCLYVFYWGIGHYGYLSLATFLLAILVVIDCVLACFVLLTQAHRTTSTFLPMRDYRFFYDQAQRMDA